MGSVKIMAKLSNILINLFNLSKALYKDRIHWESNYCSKVDCKIDKNAKIYKPYRLKELEVGYGTYISTNSVISKATIGKFCSIGPNFFCGWGIHPLNGISTSPVFYSTKKQAGFTLSIEDKISERYHINIGNDVFIGANVLVLDGVTIGNGSVIGAGSIVSKNIPPYSIAVGSPIKIISYRFNEQIINKLEEIKWWDGDETKLIEVEKLFFEIEKFINIDHKINNTN